MKKHCSLLSTSDLSSQSLEEVLALATHGKECAWKEFRYALAGKVIGLLFFNPSLRTRASFLSGIARLGGQAVPLASGSDTWSMEFLPGAIMNLDKTEHVKDAAMVLSSYFDLLAIRCFPKLESWEEDRQDLVLESFREHLQIPLLSMEGSVWHPCQALADALTLKERFGKTLKKQSFVLSWAPHPKQLPMAVPHSAGLIAAQLGMQVRIACPEGYDLDRQYLGQISEAAEMNGGGLKLFHSQDEALKDAQVVYAKSWTPPAYIGKKPEEMERRKSLGNWMITREKMAKTDDAIFMHCLPVRRNVEVADAVLDGSQSVIATQVANRMHAQNALLISMLNEGVNHE